MDARAVGDQLSGPSQATNEPRIGRASEVVGIAAPALIAIALVYALIANASRDHVATAVEACATVALALFAIVQIVIEGRRAAERQDARAREIESAFAATEQRVSFLAYDLRRKILSWHRSDRKPITDVFVWALAERAKLTFYFEPAERRIDEISQLTPRLRPVNRAAATRAIVLFLMVTNRINKYVAANANLDSVLDGVGTTTDLGELIEILEEQLILDEFKSAEIGIDARSAAQLEALGQTTPPPQVGGVARET